ncbi:putative Zinc knuckle-containing protein 9 [Homarus americanus]|uniref:Putative Zinc knuckle-containing protein 9 n=1 Tax=Homarus americanus TaxID=6706 RepID=A0A8J5JL26_HOMAM|nr:putative Zinc knuckle-containing protein 9 [Homarus americanus]
MKCYRCGEVGHLKSQGRTAQKSAGLTVSWEKPRSFHNDVTGTRHCEVKKPARDFEAFIPEGKISVEGGSKRKIKVLRNTWANQSVALKKSLERTVESRSGDEVKVKVLGSKLIMPIHELNLEIDLVIGKVKVVVTMNYRLTSGYVIG